MGGRYGVFGGVTALRPGGGQGGGEDQRGEGGDDGGGAVQSVSLVTVSG
ncbi:MAG: hypothetical protein FWB94_09955 [Chitinispirillia bacterium]|nr:hypothetical protein [Chitinispirillia bacterium]